MHRNPIYAILQQCCDRIDVYIHQCHTICIAASVFDRFYMYSRRFYLFLSLFRRRHNWNWYSCHHWRSKQTLNHIITVWYIINHAVSFSALNVIAPEQCFGYRFYSVISCYFFQRWSTCLFPSLPISATVVSMQPWGRHIGWNRLFADYLYIMFIDIHCA